MTLRVAFFFLNAKDIPHDFSLGPCKASALQVLRQKSKKNLSRHTARGPDPSWSRFYNAAMARAPDHGHSAHRATENAPKNIHIRVYRAARTALSFPAHTALENACARCKTQWESKVMECRYTTPTGGSVPEWERKAKYPPEPRDRASRASRAARLPESTKTLARRAPRPWRAALRAKVWAIFGP